MKNRNCKIVWDLLPMYVEELTSEESDTFIREHLDTCKDCEAYLNNLTRDFPLENSPNEPLEMNDKQMIKDIKRNINRTLALTLLIGLLFGVYGSMMFLQINEFLSILIIYPIATLLIGLLSYFVFKSIWIAPVTTFLISLLSMFLFFNSSFMIWVMIYAGICLAGALIGKGITYFFKDTEI